MSNLNLKQMCLLELSGELSPAARRQLLARLANDPEASQLFETLRDQYSVLNVLPIPEPSAEERQRIPRTFKRAIRIALEAPHKSARRARMLIRYAVGGLALAACLMFAVSTWSLDQSQARRQESQAAGIIATIDRVTLTAQPSKSAYDQALRDVEASIRELQTESPTIASLQDNGLTNLIYALANMPPELDSPELNGEDWPTGQPN